MALNERCPNTSWQCRRNRNSPSRQIIATRRSQSPDSETEQNTKNQWELGEIAFLKKADHFTKGERETLLDSQNVRDKATGHPVIILDRSPDRKLYVITTVSAYKSDRRNDYLPPWKQNCHFQKDEDGFRAFAGSEKPDNNRPHLRLAGGERWPKPKTSWVYIHFCSVVPASVLINYDKPACQLRMDPESFEDLCIHMHQKSRLYRFRWKTNAKDAKEAAQKRFGISRVPWRPGDKEYESQTSTCWFRFTHTADRNRSPVPSQSQTITRQRAALTQGTINYSQQQQGYSPKSQSNTENHITYQLYDSHASNKFGEFHHEPNTQIKQHRVSWAQIAGSRTDNVRCDETKP